MSATLLCKMEEASTKLREVERDLRAYEEEFRRHLECGSLHEADKYRMLLIVLRHERDEHLLDIYHTEHELRALGAF